MNENKPRRRAQAQAAQKATRKSGLSRFVLMVTMMALVAVVSIGGTMAWLQDNTEEVVNTFTSSDVNISIDETGAVKDPDTNKWNKEFKMIPGATIDKDPKVTVKKGSEEIYLFVQLTKSGNYDDFMEEYQTAEGWIPLEGVTGVYYREVAALTAEDSQDVTFNVLKENKVKVKTSVTKDQMNALTADTYPTLTVQAYAVQKLGLNTALAAWQTLPGNSAVEEVPGEGN